MIARLQQIIGFYVKEAKIFDIRYIYFQIEISLNQTWKTQQRFQCTICLYSVSSVQTLNYLLFKRMNGFNNRFIISFS